MAFKRYAAAGFGPELLPIIPPGADLSPYSELDPNERGKVPGELGKYGWKGFSGWQRSEATEEEHDRWEASGAGVGLQARNFPAVDVDVTEQSFSNQIAAMAGMFLGAAPERVGRAPKRLLPYKLADGAAPITKRRVEFFLPDDPETKHIVEVLGAGQQYVVEGTHAKTGNPYVWTGGQSPADLGPDDLTPVNASAVDGFLDAVVNAVEAAGGTVRGRSEGDGAARTHVNQSGLQGDPARIKEALANWPCADLDYDTWIKACAAIKAAFGEDEEHYPAFEDWCLGYPDNTPEVARKKWDSLHPPYSIGAEWVFRQAAAAGWVGYATGVFQALPDVTEEEEMADAPEIVREWVYAMEAERFVRLSDRLRLKENQFIRQHARDGYKLSGEASAAARFFAHPARRVLDAMTYLPGGPALCRVEGKSAINVWTPAEAVEKSKAACRFVADADVAMYLDHMERLIPDKRVRDYFLDWMAWVVQNPAGKPNWALFLGGVQGIGKDLAFLPLMKGVGPQNTRTAQPGELASEYTDWVAFKRLVLVEEMRNFETKAVMNKLKMYITSPPESVPIHLKFMPIFEVPNVACFVFMSNYRDALAIEKGDRRYLVYWSPMQPEARSYYVALGGWLGAGGTEDVVTWLLQRDVRNFDATGRAPETDAKTDMEEAGRNDFEQAVVEAIEAGAPPFDGDLCTLQTLWAALPLEVRRLQGAGIKRLGWAIQAAGGRQLKAPDGSGRRVRLDPASLGVGEKRFGQPRLWSLRAPEVYEGMGDDALREIFRGTWVAGAPFEARGAAQ